MLTRAQAVEFLARTPYKLGHLVGFDRLTELHNGWIVDMVRGNGDRTLQAHRGSYKTTCVSIALAAITVLFPNDKVLFLRKTDNDIKEVISQVKKILESAQVKYLVSAIYGVDLRLTTSAAGEISTNLCTDIRGASQLVGLGTGGSLTGKHFDRIFTDDIVNIQDRISRAERDRTKVIYQELRNIVNRGGRIFNTGTPWHKDDAFTLMPDADKYDCYSTGLISEEQIAEIREKMTTSLFAANYELRHIAAEDVIFTSPTLGADCSLAEQGICHVDAAYGGEDYTAMTICRKKDGKYYVLGKLWRSHVDDVIPQIIELRKKLCAGQIICENNGDKGYLARDLRAKGERVTVYHENMNKFLKITSYLKAEWANVIFVEGTDSEYINQVCDYSETAEHDDAPDSLASIIRKLWRQGDKKEYTPIFM